MVESTFNSDYFNLTNWKITLPVDSSGGISGTAVEVKNLIGYENSKYFYDAPDGSMVFNAMVEGATTSGSRYARSELREMKGVDRAAWKLSEGGTMTATLKVDKVPTKFDGSPGRVIVGQIHGQDKELIRLYYENGTVYFMNDQAGSSNSEMKFTFKNASGQAPSISIGEKFAYKIDARGDTMKVDIYADGQVYNSTTKINSVWQTDTFYFKAGVYLGVNETTGTGVGQTSFYGLDFSHTAGAGLGGIKLGTTPTPTPTDPVPTNPNLIVGTSSNDTLTGTSGNDTISGNGGNDTLTGGAGSDQIAGGAGTDLLVYSKALTSYTVTFATDGTLTVKDNSGTDGTDKVAADVESFKFGSTTYSLTQLKAAVTPVPTPTDPTPTPTTPTTPATLTGTAASETLTGTAGADIIDGGAGRDTIDGGLGTDTVTYAKSTAGVNIDLERSSQLGGHAEGDVLRNVENVEGSAFADRIFGNDFANVLTGGAGADTIDGDAGHDTIVGGAGNDKLDGDEGNDVFVFGPASGQDIVYDFSTDGDRIQISGVTGFTSAANVLSRAVQSGENVLIDLGGGNTITLDGIDRSDLTAANILIG